jgi:acyl-CoA reductase-like NAD-dependent aldehyde dehydrogenase
MQEETFGPVIAVIPFKTIDQAIHIANDTNYGLSASVWGRDVRRAKGVALRIQSGDVNINTSIIGFATPSLEFGGVKDSGLGRRGGRQGLLKYTQAQGILTDNFPLTPDAPTLYTEFRIKLFYMQRWFKRWLPFIGT